MKTLVPKLFIVACLGLGSVRAQEIELSPSRLDNVVGRINATTEYDMRLSAELQALLRDDPAAIKAIPGLLLSGEADSDTADMMILALEEIGTPDAQRSLGQIFSEPEQRHLDRLRAVVAAGALASPTEETVSDLWNVALFRSDPESADVANTATLSLGIVGHTLREKTPARYPKLRSGLVNSLHQTGDLIERSMLLKALGNLKDTELAYEVSNYLFDESAPIRASAAQSLGAMRSDASLDLLTATLQNERRGAVRAAIVGSMRRLQASEQSLRAIHTRVLEEPHPQARAAMVQYLGEHLEAIPEARAALEHLLRNDPTKRVRILAGTALYS